MRKALNDFNVLVENVTDLYTKIESIIGEKYPDLCEEFLIFLTPAQAKELGKYLSHFMLTNMSLFLQNLLQDLLQGSAGVIEENLQRFNDSFE